MKSLLKRLGGGTHPPAASDGAQHKRLSLKEFPDTLYAIGDPHGCLDLYKALEERIAADAKAEGLTGRGLIVLLGDLVDRGPQSAQMIDHVMGPAPQGFSRLVLLGNHEQMMSKFLDSPSPDHEWLSFGGRETLMSYGLSLDHYQSEALTVRKLRNLIDAHVTESHKDFLKARPVSLKIGSTLFSHAGFNVAKSFEAQEVDDFIWGDPRLCDASDEAVRLVHGHIVVEKVLLSDRRIALDTGAYQSDRLSAVRFKNATVSQCLEANRFGPDGNVQVDVSTPL